MNSSDLNQPLIARLEREIGILKGALNLARERAEDAEADLAEASRDLALESQRADAAERERDNARVEAMGHARELDQLRNAIDEHNAQAPVIWQPIEVPAHGLTSAASAAAEDADRQPASGESLAVAAIAAELIAVVTTWARTCRSDRHRERAPRLPVFGKKP